MKNYITILMALLSWHFASAQIVNESIIKIENDTYLTGENSCRSVAGSTLNFDLDGQADYSFATINGTVDITDATLDLHGSYVPVDGDEFTIIRNDGADPVTGTFDGLPEGATVTVNGIDMTISYSDGDGNDVVLTYQLLAVELLSFTAHEQDRIVHLNWSTAFEEDSEGFEIQRSIDGLAFEEMGFVKSQGNSIETQEYVFLDENVRGHSTYYYRLKQLDFDGEFTYSEIKVIKLTGKSTLTLGSLYPNPASQTAMTIQLEVMLPTKSDILVSIYDVMGRRVEQLERNLDAGFNTIDLDLAGLSAGQYIISVQADREQVSKKLLVY